MLLQIIPALIVPMQIIPALIVLLQIIPALIVPLQIIPALIVLLQIIPAQIVLLQSALLTISPPLIVSTVSSTDYHRSIDRVADHQGTTAVNLNDNQTSTEYYCRHKLAEMYKIGQSQSNVTQDLACR